MEKSKQQKNKVRFMVVREFSGEKSMREAFEQLIERQTCEHFEEWLEQFGWQAYKPNHEANHLKLHSVRWRRTLRKNG